MLPAMFIGSKYIKATKIDNKKELLPAATTYILHHQPKDKMITEILASPNYRVLK